MSDLMGTDGRADKIEAKQFPVSTRPLPPEMMGQGFDGDLLFRPAFDDRDTPGGASQGIGGLVITFWLRGPAGAVLWTLLTGCFLPRTQTEWLDRFGDSSYKPTPGTVEWHSPVPMKEHDGGLAASCLSQPRYDCRLLGPGQPCYSDISYGIGDKAYEALVSGGEAALWQFLLKMYRHQFEPKQGDAP